MKIRNGFVSNSSSSSFVINAFSANEVRMYIEKLLEAERVIGNYENVSIDDICIIREEPSVKPINKILEDYQKYNDDGHWDLFEDHGEAIVIVDSTNDNSIPWSIQESLERISLRRLHWG